MHPHNFTYSEEESLLHLTCKNKITLENSFEFLTEVVNHRQFPNDIYILLDHSKAELGISMTEIHFLEAFQRKYIDGFDTVHLAIIPSKGEKSVLSLYYEALITNKNCTSKVFDSTQEAKTWLVTQNIKNEV